MLSLEEYKQRDSFNGKEMCELIAHFWNNERPWEQEEWNNKTPDQIWNYSPTGELFMVGEWFKQAQIYYKLIPCTKCKEYNQIVKVDINYGENKEEVLVSEYGDYIYLCEKCS